MARIPITTSDTITRLGDSCIDDLLELYTPKDLTKEKENLLTLYINHSPTQNKFESFAKFNFELQLNSIREDRIFELGKYLFLNDHLISQVYPKNTTFEAILFIPAFPKVALLEKYYDSKEKYNPKLIKNFIDSLKVKATSINELTTLKNHLVETLIFLSNKENINLNSFSYLDSDEFALKAVSIFYNCLTKKNNQYYGNNNNILNVQKIANEHGQMFLDDVKSLVLKHIFEKSFQSKNKNKKVVI